MAGLGYLVYLVNTSSKGARLIGSKLVVARYTSGELFTVVPNCPCRNPCRTPAAPCIKHATTPSGNYRSWRREYPMLTRHTQKHTNRQHHTNNNKQQWNKWAFSSRGHIASKLIQIVKPGIDMSKNIFLLHGNEAIGNKIIYQKMTLLCLLIPEHPFLCQGICFHDEDQFGFKSFTY